jgi:hypothetical protein
MMEEKDKDESVTVIIELEFDKSPTYFEVLDSLNAQMDDGCLNYFEKNSPAHMHSLEFK